MQSSPHCRLMWSGSEHIISTSWCFVSGWERSHVAAYWGCFFSDWANNHWRPQGQPGSWLLPTPSLNHTQLTVCLSTCTLVFPSLKWLFRNTKDPYCGLLKRKDAINGLKGIYTPIFFFFSVIGGWSDHLDAACGCCVSRLNQAPSLNDGSQNDKLCVAAKTTVRSYSSDLYEFNRTPGGCGEA